MQKIEIVINGVSYPCRPTMGAMLRFKKLTGKEVTEIANNGFSDLCAYLYCCVASASHADGMEFKYTLEDFADALSPEDMNEWAEKMQANTTTADIEEEKKS